ncbi:hypothetical protein SISSUDRAFT_972953, partial [Sistotremastrum suecicum HHB10207 ss-3]
RDIPIPQKELIVIMRRTMTVKAIAAATEISERAITRVLKNFRDTGSVTGQRLCPIGRPRELSSWDVDYLESLIERKPDIFLSELQQSLRNACNVEVSAETIGRSLKRRGLTRKTVSSI